MKTFDQVFNEWKNINNKLFKDKHSVAVHEELFRIVGGAQPQEFIVTNIMKNGVATGLVMNGIKFGNAWSMWITGTTVIDIDWNEGDYIITAEEFEPFRQYIGLDFTSVGYTDDEVTPLGFLLSFGTTGLKLRHPLSLLTNHTMSWREVLL
jgi:hypothetical protein